MMILTQISAPSMSEYDININSCSLILWCLSSTNLSNTPMKQARIQLRAPAVANSFLRGLKNLKLCPIVFNCAQHTFPRGRKISQGEYVQWRNYMFEPCEQSLPEGGPLVTLEGSISQNW